MDSTEKKVRYQLGAYTLSGKTFLNERFRVDVQLFSHTWTHRGVFTVHPHFDCRLDDLPSTIAKFIDDKNPTPGTFWIIGVTRTRPVAEYKKIYRALRHAASIY